MTHIETLKLALEALLEDRAWLESDAPKEAWDKNNQAITSLRQAIEQAQQDVDWEKLYRLEVKKKEAIAAKYEQDIKPLTKIVPMAQQAEPVAWGVHDQIALEKSLANYTPPPPRQPLTSKQIREWWASENGFEDCNMARLDDFEQVVRAVEGKHGIKGEA